MQYSDRYRTDDFFLLSVDQSVLNESLTSPVVQFLVGRTLLLEALREEDISVTRPLVYRYGSFGKPYLRDHPDIFFNISHCRDAVVCVLARHEIGVDVESLIPLDQAFMETILNPDEIALVWQSPEPERTLTQFWTKKESLIKYLGTGMSEPLPSLLDHVAVMSNAAAEKNRAFEKNLAAEKNRAAEKNLAAEKNRAAEKNLAAEKNRAVKPLSAEKKTAVEFFPLSRPNYEICVCVSSSLRSSNAKHAKLTE